MYKQHRKWLKSWSLWIGAACVVGLGLAAACSDTTAPRFVPPDDDSTADTSEVGFLIVPAIQGEVWV